MGKIENGQHRFGLLGKDISYSFSKGYFTKKFSDLGLNNHSYENFDLPSIAQFMGLIENTKDLEGLNVTIPYKEAVIPYLTELHYKAEQIGAVNTIKFTKKGLVGYNTDAYGFEKSIEPLLKKQHGKALILGTGGASKAVAYVFGTLKIDYKFVSRTQGQNRITYGELTREVMEDHSILVNCTPLGTHPDISRKPPVPYQFLGSDHLLFDLIYNPDQTAFLKEGKAKGAVISNGLRMLELQAEKAWEIWGV